MGALVLPVEGAFRTMMKNRLFLAAALCCGSVHAADSYRVTGETLLESPARFGANFEIKAFTPWSEQMNNSWNRYYSCEPIVFRHNGVATGGGADFLEEKTGQPVSEKPYPGSPGSGFWSSMGNGFWNGADIRIYRPTETSIRLVRKGRVKQFNGLKDTDQRITLEDEGEPLQRGDLYVLTMTRNDVPDALNPERPQNRQRQLYAELPTKQSGVTWSMDTTTFCPENGSTASMKIVIPRSGDKPAGFEHQFLRFGGRECGFESGKTYHCEVWLKQEGLGGPVTVQVGDRATKDFEVGAEWRKYEFPVPNDAPVGPGVYNLLVGARTAGTLWMDNLLVAQDNVSPFAVFPRWVDILKDFRLGVLRSMSGRQLLTLDAWLSDGFTRKLVWDVNAGPQSRGDFSLREQLELCRATGARPWLMTYVLPDDEELDRLMEYLGAPADVGYGQVRAAQGQVEPWTEVFDTIYVECANEMWNAKFFAPQAFDNQPALAGKAANRVFERLKGSPHNRRGNIKCIGPAWAHNLYGNGKGWTEVAAENCPSMDVLGTAPSGYIGGYDGETIVGAKDDDLFQANLLYSAQVLEPKLAEIGRIRAGFKERTGRELEMLKYEAGPGYAIPTANRPFIEEAERVGKSLALGVATLDNFLFVMANNGNANFFQVRVGPNWASHNAQYDPQPAWLALLLRNKYCEGRLLKVEPLEVERVDLPERKSVGLGNDGRPSDKIIAARSGVPMTQLYAFADGGRYSFIALNRSFTCQKTIRLTLPYVPETEFVCYMLSHPDPRMTNREGSPVRIREERKTGFRDGFEIVLPPSSALVLVNHAAARGEGAP